MIRYPGRLLATLPALLVAILPQLAVASPSDGAGGVQLSLSEPTDYEIVQRSPAGGEVAIQGLWDVPKETPAPEKLEARLVKADAADAGGSGWVALPFDAHARGFRTTLPVKEAGWYELQVRVWRHQAPDSTLIVPHVGVGDVYLVLSGGPDGPLPHASGQVALCEHAHWEPLEESPGASEAPWLAALGEAFAARTGVPVGLLRLSGGQTKATEWLPLDFPVSEADGASSHVVALPGGRLVSDGTLFSELASSLKRRGHAGLRAVIWAGPGDPAERDALLSVRKALRETALPWFVPSAMAAGTDRLLPAGGAGGPPSDWTDALQKALGQP